jgi:hypothetical protein
VLYLLAGRLEHTLSDQTFTLEPGDTLAIPPGVFHNARSVGDVDADMIVAYSTGVRDFVLESATRQRTDWPPMRVLYNQESERRVRLAAIGCGGHAQRNIFPDVSVRLHRSGGRVRPGPGPGRSVRAAVRRPGVPGLLDYGDMLARERPDAVTVVTNYDAQGRPRYPAIAMDVLRAGAHAWIEKPPPRASPRSRR